MGQVNVIEDLLFSQAAGNGFTARCLPSMDRERPKPPADTSTTHQAALDTIADMRELVIRRRAHQDANVELLRGVLRRPVIHPEHNARDLLAAASAKFDALADATDNLHERGSWARAQEQTARYAATLAYVRTLEDGIPDSWEHVHYTRPEADQAEAVITWHGDLIRSYAVQAASEKVTRLANETITMLREKREKVVKEDGSIAARNVIARLGKSELRTDAALREQVLDVLVVHRHLIPTARRGHYMMVVPHDYAPTDKVSWGSGTGWPAVSITSKKRRAPKAELDSISRRGPVGKLRNSYEPKGCDGKRRISQEAGALPRFKRGGE